MSVHDQLVQADVDRERNEPRIVTVVRPRFASEKDNARPVINMRTARGISAALRIRLRSSSMSF